MRRLCNGFSHRWHPWQFVGGLIFQRSFNVWPISHCVSFFFFERSSCASSGSTIFRDKLRRLNIVRFPIEIENLIFRPQIIFGVAVAIQTPRHAVWLGDVNRRHVIHRTVAAEATDAAVHVRRVIVINVIDRAIEPHPFDRLAALPAILHRLKLWIVLCHLRVAVHARLRVRHIGLRGDFYEAVTVATIHTELCHVNIVRKRHRLGRLVTDFGIFRRGVIPRGGGQAADRPQSRRRSS